MTRDRDAEGPASLAALVRRLPREVAPPPDVWENIAARLEPRGRLDHLTASLPARVEPPEDLWRKIEARIAPRRRIPRTAVALAASVVGAAAITLGIRLGERNDATREPSSASFVADETASYGASAAIDFGWMLGAPAAAGDVAAEMGDELSLVRGERLSIERAIAKEPDNADLRELWAFTYETELQLADAYGRTVMEYQRDRG
jgi:hypothetical protein